MIYTQPLHNEFEAEAKEIQFRDEMQMRTVWIETRVEGPFLLEVAASLWYKIVLLLPFTTITYVYLHDLNVIAVQNVITISGVNTLDKITNCNVPFCCCNFSKPYLAILLVFSSWWMDTSRNKSWHQMSLSALRCAWQSMICQWARNGDWVIVVSRSKNPSTSSEAVEVS